MFKGFCKLTAWSSPIWGSSAYLAIKKRPLPSWMQNDDEKPHEASFVFKPDEEKENFLLTLARTFVTLPVFFFGRILCSQLNNLTMVDQHHFTEALLNRPNDRSLLTVANHHSTLDDPGLVSCIAPKQSGLIPQMMRWGLCSQDLCFNRFAWQSIVGTGKVLPIERGGGIEQMNLFHFTKKLSNPRNWCHIFPEGYCASFAMKGRLAKRLKWGVGKAIASCEKPPIVIPFFHLGMRDVMPMDEDNEMTGYIPTTGNDIVVKFGPPIEFDDLFEEYRLRVEKEHPGKSAHEVLSAKKWFHKPTENDKWLYSAIAARIHTELKSLEGDVFSIKNKEKILAMSEMVVQ
eukprot:TRINITY_DN11266_c0_g1_i1.p1 TRINITY_DN11266_c0_g1~~TRINITY_DN11266_c0_g1_i1.p1  ORF type:complete len:345 (+),score=73.70 TRINITY_DN11266_c0_g1_i1:54-1088(+)